MKNDNMKQHLNITNSEMAVMRVIWSMGKANSADVEAQIAERQNWTVATIKTLLGRLVKKEMLAKVRGGRFYTYTANISEDEALKKMGEELLSETCKTRQPMILSNLIKSTSLTSEDVKQLKILLDQKETVTEVECTCIKDFGVCIHMGQYAM